MAAALLLAGQRDDVGDKQLELGVGPAPPGMAMMETISP